jgi:S1-C subfamily serine protease
VQKGVDPARVQGAVYVAPLDAAGFVRSVARLRAAQAAYAAEVARRAADPAAAAGKVVLNGTEFPDLQAAEAYLVTLGESLQVTDAARFGQTFAGMLAEEVRARFAPQGLRVLDLGFTLQSDRQLVEGTLAQGGLVRSLSAREALKASGVGLVVAPRLERVGDAFEVHVEAFDVAAGAVLASGDATIPPALVPELQRALGGEQLQPVGDVQRTSGPWNALYERARGGVVQVAGPEGRGTGFVVRKDGLVLTNDHVVRAAGSPLTVTFEGGAPLPARVAAQDAAWDLAALQVEGMPAGAHVFEFADDVRVGAEVAVLGHPRDSAGWVLTPGHVSSTSEEVPTEGGGSRRSIMYTCPTRQGSSGSPVLLADGRVVAVHAAGRVGQSLSGADAATELTGFALGVPGAQAREFVARTVRP